MRQLALLVLVLVPVPVPSHSLSLSSTIVGKCRGNLIRDESFSFGVKTEKRTLALMDRSK